MKNIALLSTGVLIAQVITILTQPIIARLYSPVEFGILAIITSTVAIFTPLLTLQYHMGIISAKSDREANNVSALTFSILILTSLFISVGLIIYNRIFPSSFEEVGNWIYIVIPLLLIAGLGNILDAYNNRFGQYKLMASIAIVRSTAGNSLKIILGLINGGFLGLIISHFLSMVLGIRRQGKYVITKIHEIFDTSLYDMKNVAIKYKVQPLFSMPGLFVTTVSFSILPILITTIYSVEETGYFSMSILVLGVPLTLISTNVAKVFFKNATIEKQKTGNFYSTFKSTSFLLSLLAVIGFPLLWFISEPLFSTVLGQEWHRSGTFVKILVPMFATRFIVTSLMHGFIISGRQLLKLILQSLFIIQIAIIVMIVEFYSLPIEYFLGLVNYFYLANYLILFAVLYFTSKKID